MGECSGSNAGLFGGRRTIDNLEQGNCDIRNLHLLRVVRSGIVAALATFSIGAAMLPGAARAAEPIKVVIGYQSLWAAGGEVVEALRHTNIFELNGISAEFKTFTFGGPLAEAAVAGDI